METQRFWSPTREILVLYFSNLEKFLFSEAIAVVKSLTDASPDDAVWALLPSLQLLAAAEALYYNLYFLRMQEGAKVSQLYDIVTGMLNKVTNDLEAQLKSFPSSKSPNVARRDSRTPEDAQTHLSLAFYSQLVKQLLLLVVMRKRHIVVYQSLSNITLLKDFDSDAAKLKSTYLSAPDTITHPFLIQIRQNLLYEVLLLEKTILCESALSQCDAQNSVFYFEQVQADLHAMDAKFRFSQAHQESEDETAASATAKFASLPLANLFFRLRDVFREKLLLYFGSDSDARIMSALVNFNPRETWYHTRVARFVSETSCLHVIVLLDPTKTSIKKQGSGLSAYPSLFSYPSIIPPREHWPNLISLIQDHDDVLSRDDFQYPVHYFDTKVTTSYFLRRMQQGVILVAIFPDQRDPLEEGVVQFFAEISSFLRLQTAFSATSVTK
eukprot:TRINITY_DN4311_c0_g1_i2.p1 TRINITY_DN4311_c0_g1~~TRINITY_DN4311_c0_g1_i2.p1  ORF type:complete len:456 (+),score=63.97 TRINITY_DN4311_c0_g1_i2:50-1369(+)